MKDSPTTVTSLCFFAIKASCKYVAALWSLWCLQVLPLCRSRTQNKQLICSKRRRALGMTRGIYLTAVCFVWTLIPGWCHRHNHTCRLRQSPSIFPALSQPDRMCRGHVTGSAAFSAENELGQSGIVYPGKQSKIHEILNEYSRPGHHLVRHRRPYDHRVAFAARPHSSKPLPLLLFKWRTLASQLNDPSLSWLELSGQLVSPLPCRNIAS